MEVIHMPVQWLYILEALFGLIGILAALMLTRRFQQKGKPVGVLDWIARIAMGAVSLVGLAALTFLVFVAYRAIRSGIAQTGHSLAAFRFQSVKDDSWHSMSEYRGKIVLLNLWATWCGPCRGEVPDLERVQQDLGPKGVVVLMVSNQEPKLIREYLDKHPVRTEQGYVSEDSESLHLTGIHLLPLTFIVDRQGVARQFLIGVGNSSRFADLIRKYE
jgi:thiol-disulfide isomerase/thioredoxin